MPGNFSLCDSGGPQTITLDNVWAQKTVPKLIEGDQELACCDSWGRKELDTTEWLNWTEEPLASLIVRVLETLGDSRGLDSVPWMIVGVQETYINDILGGQETLHEKDYGDQEILSWL